jgi:outer membrane protein assembly factor BamB
MRRLSLSLSVLLAGPMLAQFGRGGGDWTTIGNDAQRSHWVRGDAKISPQTMSKPGFQLVWNYKMDIRARQLNSLTPPALIDFYIGYRGFRTLGFFGASSDKVIAIDTDLSRLEWEKDFSSPAGGGTPQCPGGMTSSVTRPSFTAYPGAFAARGFGRGGAAQSGVGEPFEGAVTLKRAAQPPPGPPPAPAGRPGRASAPAPNPFARAPQYVHAVTADGKFHSMYLSNGEEPNPPVDFLPPNANAIGLIVFDGRAYVATINSCSGVDNGIWALDLQSKKVISWKSPANIAGTEGFAAGPDGTIYVAAGNELVALEPATLKQKASFKAGSSFSSSPLVFEHNDKDLIAVTTTDGRLHIFDSALTGTSSLARSPEAGLAGGALAGFEDNNTRWILSPAKSGIIAWKLTGNNGALALEKGWTSRQMAHPLTPAIVNAVIFALDGGSNSGNAVLYALDSTGKELWSSGKTITTFVRTGGLSAGGGRVYVGAHDGTQYAFGFPMEH